MVDDMQKKQDLDIDTARSVKLETVNWITSNLQYFLYDGFERSWADIRKIDALNESANWIVSGIRAASNAALSIMVFDNKKPFGESQ